MVECPEFGYLLIVPRLRVQNANAISSPQTHGFPAMTAFLGLMWALERKTREAALDLQFNAVGVVVHKHQEQATDDFFVKTFRLSRNPVDKHGKTSAIVEEGRIHLELSLVFAVQSDALKDEDEKKQVAEQVRGLIHQMRVAGGSVLPSRARGRRQQPYVTSEADFKQTMLHLLPGFALVERQDMLERRYEELKARQADVSRLDAWLSLSRINWRYDAEAENDKSKWQHDRTGLGWLVPVPLGYGALSEIQQPGTVANARDQDVPFRFVESLYGMGQWLSPHHLDKPQQLLWYADSRPDEGLYRCRNDYRPDLLVEND